MPKASTLAKMSDEEYKKLTPLELQAYNNELPETDYANPYSHQPYPKMVYRLNNGMVESATVRNEKEHKRLGEEWTESLLSLGVETAPGAPEIAVTGFTIPIPAKGVDAAAGK
jgi:hypothetical protein